MCQETNVFKRIILFVERADEELNQFSTMFGIDAKGYYSHLFECDYKIIDDYTFIKLKMDYLKLMDQAIVFIEEKLKRTSRSINILRELQGKIANLNLRDDDNIIRDFQIFCNRILENLELLEENYAEQLNTPVVSDSDLVKIVSQLNDLVEDIKTSNINNDFKVSIIKNLNDLKLSIDKYSILGVEGIKDDINKLSGAIFLGIKNPNCVQDEDISILKKIIDVIDNANSIFDFGGHFTQIGTAITPLIAIVDKILG